MHLEFVQAGLEFVSSTDQVKTRVGLRCWNRVCLNLGQATQFLAERDAAENTSLENIKR